MHIVEVRYSSGGLAKLMGQMRSWLDNHQSVPQLFSTDGELCHVEFEAESEASAFAAAFDAAVISPPEEKHAA